jgi:hypothetical protein
MTATISHPQEIVSPVANGDVKSRHRNEAARQLLREWRADTSGYDEEAWPKVKRIIEENRLSARSKFGD